MRGDETVGVVIIADTDDSTARLSLDYVTRGSATSPWKVRLRGFRDLRKAGRAANPGTRCDTDYLQKMGFRKESDGWVREVRAAPMA